MMEVTKETRECVQACLDCHNCCTQMIAACMEADHCDSKTMKMLMDCAQMCQMCAGLMLRGSDMSGKMCAMCVEMCNACALACETMAKGNARLMQCAKACRACADMCMRLVSKAKAA